jgi:hypothetical protein
MREKKYLNMLTEEKKNQPAKSQGIKKRKEKSRQSYLMV